MVFARYVVVSIASEIPAHTFVVYCAFVQICFATAHMLQFLVIAAGLSWCTTHQVQDEQGLVLHMQQGSFVGGSSASVYIYIYINPTKLSLSTAARSPNASLIPLGLRVWGLPLSDFTITGLKASCESAIQRKVFCGQAAQILKRRQHPAKRYGC